MTPTAAGAPFTRTSRLARLEGLLQERILVLDGAMGTMLQRHRLTEEDYRGARFADHPRDLRGDSDLLCLTQPAIVREIHAAYLEAGADVVSTNSFTATRIAQADYGLSDVAREINEAAARLAREAADEAEARDGRPRYVGGSVGPTNRTASISPDVNDPAARNVTFPELVGAYRESAEGLIAGGADILLVETIFDTLNAKAAIVGLEEAFEATGDRLPLVISGTITDASGRTLSGQTVEAFWASIRHAKPLLVGLNCALGAKQLREHVEELGRIADLPLAAYPNAGLPNELGGYDETPPVTATALGEWARAGLVNVAGSCCGSTPEHTRAIADAVAGIPPRVIPEVPPVTLLSGLEPLVIPMPGGAFVNIGERTNVTGSRQFARLMAAGREGEDQAVEVARDQVVNGAVILDVNMDEAMLDGVEAMTRFLRRLATEPDIAKVPFMVDSSRWGVIEAGLQQLQGRGVVNSISLKEGEDEFLRQARLCRRYGASVVVMAFDEQGQADTVERRVDVLTRAHTPADRPRSGFAPEDIILDPNIFAIATGMEEHADYANAFFEATRRVKATIPHARVSGGVSNVSFAFRGNDRVREAIHAVFLYHAIRAGLDMAIVNAGRHPAVRRHRARAQGAGRGRRAQPPPGRHRPPARDRATLRRRRGRGQGRRGPRVARAARQRAPHPRPGRGHGRVDRRGHRGGAAGLDPPARRDRGAADGRHEHRRRPVRLGADVPAPGRQERPGDEEGGRPPHPVPRGAARGHRPARGHDRHGHRQGRRPRHRQEHRRASCWAATTTR